MRRWRINEWTALGEIAVVVALIIADLHHLVWFSKTPYLFAIGWISLRLRGLGWRDVGLACPPRSWRAIAVGTAAGLVLECLSVFVTEPALARLMGKEPDLSDFRPVIGNLGLLALFLGLNWVLAAFGEETVYRGYLMNRAADLGAGTRGAWVVSLFVVSALFGWGHVDQEVTGMLQAGVDGLGLGLLYLASGRNLTVPIVAHGVSNSMAFVMIYFGRYPGL